MGAKQCQISHVRFPREVKYISKNRDNANNTFYRNVSDHTEEYMSRGAHPCGFKDEITREHSTERISDTWDQSNNPVEADTVRRSWNRPSRVEHLAQPV